MKRLLTFLFVFVAAAILCMPVVSQESEKDSKVTIKIVKKHNGEVISYDTVVGSEDDAMRIIKLKTDNLDDESGTIETEVEVLIDSLSKGIHMFKMDDAKVMEWHCDSLEDHHVIMIKGLNDDESSLEEIRMDLRLKEAELEELEGELEKEMKLEVIVNGDDGDSTIVKKIIFCDDKEIIREHVDGDARVIIKKLSSDTEEGAKMMTVHVCLISSAEIMEIEEEDKESFGSVLKETGVAASSQLAVEKMDFFPNPSDGAFTIDMVVQDKGPVDIKIFDLNGKKVQDVTIESDERHINMDMDLRGHPAGTYIMIVKQGNAALTRKVVLK